jgi:Rrf2 family protein
MPLLPRKGVLAIAAVIDIALHANGRPVAAKALARRHDLPPRHLEPVLQALVREGILKGVRGPRGGYELARERDRITANDILRAATLEEIGEPPQRTSSLLDQVVMPALAEAEEVFSAALGGISVEQLTRNAEVMRW